MLVGAALGIGFAAAIVIVVEALLAYPRLPARVPLHFNFRGEPGRPAPKLLFFSIFVALAIVLLAFTVTKVLHGAPSAREAQAGAVVDAATLILMAYVQHLIIGTVERPKKRLAVRPFWTAIFAFLAVVTAVSAVAR